MTLPADLEARLVRRDIRLRWGEADLVRGLPGVRLWGHDRYAHVSPLCRMDFGFLSFGRAAAAAAAAADGLAAVLSRVQPGDST